MQILIMLSDASVDIIFLGGKISYRIKAHRMDD